jgi:hypothetical protein
MHPSLCWDREAVPTGMFFKYNTALGPPFRVLVDTNFINFSIKNKVSPGDHTDYTGGAERAWRVSILL